jgi:cytochrome P450
MQTARIKPSPQTSATPSHADDLPGPRGWPWLGNALQVKPSQLHLQLEAWCEIHGPIYKLNMAGRHVVVVADHEAVAALLRDRPDGLRRTSRLEDVWVEMGLLPGLFGANGDVWRRQRRMVMASFDPAHVKRYFPAMQAVTLRLGGRWAKAAKAGTAIDLQADLMRYTVDTIAGLAFGSTVNTLETDGDIIQQHLDKLFPAVFKRLLSPLPYWRWVQLPADRRLARSVAAVNEAVAGFIQQARTRLANEPALRSQPGNLLEAMLVAADEPGSGIDDKQVAGNVLTMLLAGEDTTANTLAWMIELLWRNPAALARATDEVRRVCGDGHSAPTMEQLAQLDFVEACAHETMRLKPVGPFLGLQTLREMTIAGVVVPAHRVVLTVMRRDSISDTHVPHAAAFEPGRWLTDGTPGQAAHSAKRVSMPFGAGPRICPGRYLALLEMKMAMALLLGRFDIQSVDTASGQPAAEHLAFTMMPVGLRMCVNERVNERC